MNVLVVDDHKIIRSSIATHLGSAGSGVEITEADSYESGCAALADLSFQLAIIDIGLPDRSGIDLAAACKQLQPGCKLIILTGSIEPEAVRDALEISVSAYLLKTIDVSDLVSIIEIVMLGLHVYDNEVAELLSASPLMGGGKSKVLTKQQLRLAQLLATGMTNKEIARGMDISEKTVRNYLANIFDRLGVQRRSQVAVWYSKNFEHSADSI